MMLARLDTRQAGFDSALDGLLARNVVDDSEVVQTVREVIARIRAEGDQALLEFTRRFDGLECSSMAELALDRVDFTAAFDRISGVERDALESAAERIRSYHEHQRSEGWTFTDEYGNRLGQKITTLDRVGIYVPGGQANYPSTVLMTAIPARVAGVGEIVMTVPAPEGRRSDLVLAAAHVAGVDTAFTVGGAQAIAALAIGTQTIAKVDKIVGPGGIFVTAAKKLVFGEVGIDLIAGPSEVLVIADGSSPVDWVVYDLFSQAEHDASAQALLLSPNAAFLDAVYEAMDKLIAEAPRRAIIEASLARRGALIRTRSVAEAIDIANRIAPEHLELCVENPEAWLERVRHAGAIFLGAHSPEVMGDYVAGPSHVLPTSGSARFSSPLGVYDFQKRSSVIQMSPSGAEALARTSATLAHGEGLTAHAQAAEARIRQLGHNESD